MSKGRFEAFSDGVFAIAITLLVLEIHLPDSPALTNAQMTNYLAHLWPQLLTYVTSFVTVGIIWLNHHATFMQIKRIDRTTLILNLLLLLGYVSCRSRRRCSPSTDRYPPRRRSTERPSQHWGCSTDCYGCTPWSKSIARRRRHALAST